MNEIIINIAVLVVEVLINTSHEIPNMSELRELMFM